MSFRACMDYLRTLEAGLAITQPASLSVKRTYLTGPPQNQILTDLPCVLHTWDFAQLRLEIGLNWRPYTIKVDFAVAESGVEDDRSAEIALAFWEVWLEAICTDLTLGGTAVKVTPRGGNPTSVVIVQANMAYVGWEAWLDVELFKTW